jgi:Carboxypeptidase regulatory-like domain/TonB dependent receptor
MDRPLWRSAAIRILLVLAACLSALPALAQQTLGSINGTVLDASGGAVPAAIVTATEVHTGFSRTVRTQNSGYWQILDIPVGTYSVRISKDGYETVTFPSLDIQEAHPATINASLKPGSVSQTVTVTSNPLLNATDTTNGYTLDPSQIAETPLATGSFTQLAILAPGVSSQFIAGVGTNQGLGNQNIWANGQRSSSNSMSVNGVSVTNLFNGQTASQQASQRYQFNIGEGGTTGGETQDNIAVYGSNGNGLASPPPEFLQEISIVTSMYDAQQGQTSGAHIGMITKSGTNDLHGNIYGQRGTNWINADPFFYKQDVQLGTIGPQYVSPELHKWVAGATLGGPIKKDKLFFFLGYNHLYTTDQYGALAQVQVPSGLTSDRSAAGIAAACASFVTASVAGGESSSKVPTCPTTFNAAAMAILSAQLPGGQLLVPSADANAVSQLANEQPDAAEVGTSLFKGDQATGSLDYNVSGVDRISAKYFYQHMPTASPYASSNYTGFPEFQDNGAQLASLTNTVNLGTHINWAQELGVSRQKVYSNFGSAFTASGLGITMPVGNSFPGIELVDFAQYNSEATTSYLGPDSSFVDDGYFENRIAPSSDLIWSHGKHTVTVGASYSYDQLNIRNLDEGHAKLEIKYFPDFLSGSLYSGSILSGNSNRYYRSHDIGGYGMDKWQILPNVSITAGLRYDFDGPLSEKYGNLFNFDPTLYSATASAVTNAGFVVAGNNKQFGTPGVSDSTLKGRQWGLGPRVGLAWAPKKDGGTVVWRAGFGMYYDRGQYFQYLSPPAGAGISGPFGVTEEAPFAAYTSVNGDIAGTSLSTPFPDGTIAPTTPANIAALMPTIDSIESGCTDYNVYHGNGLNYDYNCLDGTPDGPLVIGNYNVNNKLPYTEDWILDMQWQPRNDMSVDIGYVGNRGKHQVIPLPFNEPVLCTPGNYQSLAPCSNSGQEYSYGLQVLSTATTTAYGAKSTPYYMANEPYDSYSGGNIDLRVPYVGYDPNSASFTASGVSSYDALQAHLQKQMSHNVQAGVSYTWSHTLDEQSDVGLFFTGDNPDNLRSSYADADFDETQNLTFNFVARSPNVIKDHGNPLHFFANDWSLLGIVVLESGQPYSIYDYHGSVGGQYFGTNADIINPIVPLQPGISPSEAKTGNTGAFTSAKAIYQNCEGGTSVYSPALNPCDFEVPLVAPGVNGVPPCDTTTDGGNAGPGGGPLCDVYETTFVPGQRNIFRQWPQKRADITIQKQIAIKERYNFVYQFEVFNVTNTPSFDVPTNSINLNPTYSELNAEDDGQQVQPKASTSVTTPTGTQTCSGAAAACAYELYTTPGAKTTTLGVVSDTIGSGRIIEMALHFTF